MLNIAHRGASAYRPENTLASFQKAIDLNVDMIELDLRCSKDGQLVVIHDKTVDRTTDGKGKVCNKDLEQLKLLNAGDGELIPTLEESLNLIGGKCLINIEIAERGVAKRLIEALQPFYYMWDSIVISSFSFKELKIFCYYMPTMKVGYLSDKITVRSIKEISQLPIYSLNLNKQIVDEHWIKWLHSLFFKVFVFTINREEDLEYMRSLNVDGVFTDRPDIFHI
jgi:glycerophosphoryl diester phosphodiesterase